MAIRSGLSNQVGMAHETTYGTSVTPVKFLPATSAKFTLVQNFVQGQGFFSGDFGPRASQNVLATVGGVGTLEMDVQNKDMGQLTMALMGTTVTPVQQSASIAYLQTHTMADPFGKSLTVQTGVTEISTGTTRPYTLLGTKVVGADFTFTPGDTMKVSWDLDAQNLVESTALAAVSYSTALTPFTGNGGAASGDVKIGTFNSEAHLEGITQATVSIKRNSNVGDYRLGNSGKKSEPIINSVQDVITGTLSADYYDKTKLADLWAAGSTPSLVISGIGANIASTFNYTYSITIPSIKFMGDTPTADSPDIINSDFPWVWVYDGTNLPFISIMEVASTTGL